MFESFPFENKGGIEEDESGKEAGNTQKGQMIFVLYINCSKNTQHSPFRFPSGS